MFGGPIPPTWQSKLDAAIVAARIALTAGLAVVAGDVAAALTSSAWTSSATFAITASTVALLGWSASGRIVPASKP